MRSSSCSSQLPLLVSEASDANKVDLYSGLASEKAGSPKGCTIPDMAGITSPSIFAFDINLHSSAISALAVIELAEPLTAIEINCHIDPLQNHTTFSHDLGFCNGV